ncbi:MAG: sulfatase-like hydrolase/transferase [Chloroflexota bacterium]
MARISRRDFIKLAGAASLLPLAGNLPQVSDLPLIGRLPTGQRLALPAVAHPGQESSPPNVIIILLDALSAFNLSVYDYPRRTSPNLEKFAQRATVFHGHHSGGNFTTPSTASLFTGQYPWTHRALSLSGLITRSVLPYNLFEQLEQGLRSYFTMSFTQNIYADMLLYQFEKHLKRHPQLDNFSRAGHTFYDNFFRRDGVYAMKSVDQFLFLREQAHGSLFLSILSDLALTLRSKLEARRLAGIYPEGLPRLSNTDVAFVLSEVIDGVIGLVDDLQPVSPFFSYLHLMPPHQPYTPTRPFIGIFDDGWNPEPKKKHRLASGLSEERLDVLRRTYDEFIANLDDELGRLFDHLEHSGLMENSYVILTSDHGEMFERGEHGHSTPLVFEPVIRIPLLVHAPGQQARQDVHALTSNVDLLPTLLHIAGLPIPEWAQGQVLPGLGGQADAQREVFVVEAKKNPAHNPLSKATVAMLRGQHKLVHYLGYKYYPDNYEFYDLANDPGEQNNLYPDHPLAREFQAELDQKLAQADHPYQNQP